MTGVQTCALPIFNMKSQILSLFALGALTFSLPGCYNDPKNMEKVVTDGKPVETLPTRMTPSKSAGTPSQSGNETGRDTKKPEMKSLSAAELGLPAYPGAESHKNPDGSERVLPVMTSAMMLEQETPDPAMQVDAFYKKNFLGATRVVAQEGGSASYRYLLSGTDGKDRVVEVKTEGKMTVIVLAAVTAPPLSPASAASPGSTVPPTTPAPGMPPSGSITR